MRPHHTVRRQPRILYASRRVRLRRWLNSVPPWWPECLCIAIGLAIAYFALRSGA